MNPAAISLLSFTFSPLPFLLHRQIRFSSTRMGCEDLAFLIDMGDHQLGGFQRIGLERPTSPEHFCEIPRA
jgi:hypothetical protein